jgi:hypothetical protein
VSGRRLELWLSGLTLATASALLALWLPNYLRWPLYLDAEHFAQIAREWDAGIARPYRDTFCYNWPGSIYLYWVGGKLFGWGKPLAVQATDVLLLLVFAGWTLVWSRRCFGRVPPGALAVLGVFGFYFNCDFRLTAQRSWQSALLAASAVMAAQALPGVRGGVASGALLGLGMLIRPDIAVWGTGVLGLLGFKAARSERPARNAARSVAALSIAVGTVLGLGMLPLLAGGLFADFVHAFHDALVGKVYDPDLARGRSIGEILSELPHYECFRGYNHGLLLLGLPCLWAAAFWRGRGDVRVSLVAWIWTGVASAVVALKAPFFVGYLVQPVVVAAPLTVAPAVAALSEDVRRSRTLGAAFLVFLGLSLVPGLPTYCAPGLACDTYGALLAGRHVGAAPCYRESAGAPADSQRRWTDYRECVGYLRKGLPRGFAVVNAVNAFGEYGGLGMIFPSHRRTGGASNVLLLPSVPEPLFDRLLRGVEDDPKTAVVIDSNQVASYPPGCADPPRTFERRQSRVVRLLRLRYRFEARFGGVEVWVRRPEDPGARVAGPSDRGQPAPRRSAR